MVITEITPNRLTLTHKPRAEVAGALAATILFAALAVFVFVRGQDAGVIFVVFAVSGPVFLYFFAETREVAFDRTTGTVTLRHKSPRGTAEASHSLAGLARAEVHRATPSREARAVSIELAAPPAGSYRAVLIYEDGSELPLAEGYTSGGRAFDEARAVNAWLDEG